MNKESGLQSRARKSEKNKGEFQKDIELMKVEIYSSHNQTMISIFISLIAGVFFSAVAIAYSRYSAGLFTLNDLNWYIGLGYAGAIILGYIVYRWYMQRLDKIEKAIILIENGKQLPPFTEIE